MVADTNIYVPVFQFGGSLTRVLTLAEEEVVYLFISPPIVEELVGVLGDKFAWSRDRLADLVDNLLSFTQFIVPRVAVEVCSDPDDDRVLECALEAGADVIVSGDNDLLRLGSFRGIPIVRPRSFLETLGQGNNVRP